MDDACKCKSCVCGKEKSNGSKLKILSKEAVSTTVKRFWVSWNEPFDSDHGDDCRPLQIPHDPRVKFWCCTGTGAGYSNMCAVVDGVNEDDVRKGVEASWSWRGEWRFFNEVASDYMPESKRFPDRT